MSRHVQSMLHPAGYSAAHISTLWWLMLTVTTIVFVLVVAVMLASVVRSRRPQCEPPSERSLLYAVSAAAVVTIITLVVLLVASVVTGRALQALGSQDALEVTVTGNQWWWSVEYADPQPSRRVRTANELHVPVGRTVAIALFSNDVIHSMWVPNLSGKIDLIPGRRNELRWLANHAGVYRGQCAEFCGPQHAHMALTVTVEPIDVFNRWLDAQRTVPPAPTDPEAILGRELFETRSCAMCHTIAGTTAGARTAPDLTHIASRPTIGAGTLPNTPEWLTQWIADPQHPKPGNKMPMPGLSDTERHAVVAYLETLR